MITISKFCRKQKIKDKRQFAARVSFYARKHRWPRKKNSKGIYKYEEKWLFSIYNNKPNFSPTLNNNDNSFVSINQFIAKYPEHATKRPRISTNASRAAIRGKIARELVSKHRFVYKEEDLISISKAINDRPQKKKAERHNANEQS